MSDKIKNIVVSVCMLAFFVGMGLWSIIDKDNDYSEAERRLLAQMPEVNGEAISSGQFMKEFESYTLDQFPMRDSFRSIKAYTEMCALMKKDNNGIYMKDGYISKVEYPLSYDMVDNAADKFNNIYNKYLKDNDITPYLVLVPDKNYYMADKYNMLSMDYEELRDRLLSSCDYMQYIDIWDKLSLSDYYRTDSHWMQECIVDVAEYISATMGTDCKAEYVSLVATDEFNGVYVGQSALDVKPDTITYLYTDDFDSCVVENFDSGKEENASIYSKKELKSDDPYEFFLEGATALITIENANANTDKELVIFRDSFGSSIAPLFIEGYKKVTLVDIRYMQSDYIGYFLDFDKQDVLFLYSTTLINNSTAFR